MYNAEKIREALCVLLQDLKEQQSTYGALTKMLYIADRECIQKFGRPITGDAMRALPQGPILSTTLDNLDGTQHAFDDIVARKGAHGVVMVKNLEPAELTYREIAVLKSVAERYGSLSWDELKRRTHQFGEWRKYDKGQDTWATISNRDIAEALGFTDDEISDMEKYQKECDELSANWVSA